MKARVRPVFRTPVNLLALDTATDACSVALRLHGELKSRCELTPRRHNQRLFELLNELLPAGSLSAAGIELLAYNEGPGSFTGLRIAAGAVQGLAFAGKLPVVGVSTLACMAQGAWRKGLLASDAWALVLLDARKDEWYRGVYRFDGHCAEAVIADAICAPAALDSHCWQDCATEVVLVSDSGQRSESLPAVLPTALRRRVAYAGETLLPDSIDILPLAERAAGRGDAVRAEQVQPVYLRDEASWQKQAGPA